MANSGSPRVTVEPSGASQVRRPVPVDRMARTGVASPKPSTPLTVLVSTRVARVISAVAGGSREATPVA